MGLFDSKSKSTSLQTATEQGQQVEDQGNAFNFAGVVSGKKNQAHINVTTSDYGAIKGALNTVDDVLELAGESTANALEFGAGAFIKAIDSADESRTQALDFSAGAFSSALSAVDDAARRSQDASNRAISASNEARRDALEFGAGAFTNALNSVDDAAGDALEAVGVAYGQSSEQLLTVADTAIKTATEATKSEASKSIELIIKMVGVVLALGVGAYAYAGSN